MPLKIAARVFDFLKCAPILDLRSPGEYACGHIPGAINFPLFSDAERALVGTLYKQEGSEAAIQLGLKLFGPKMAEVAAEASQLAKEGSIALYCWRGGMRSASIAWLLSFVGLQVTQLKGGYKSYRHFVHKEIAKQRDYLLFGGPTGSGKSEMLRRFGGDGGQVLDLEALAFHRGSAFGAIGQPPQPTQEHFENQIGSILSRFNGQSIIVEDESRLIGRCKIPDALYTQMQVAPLIVVESTREERLSRLMSEYGSFPKEALEAATRRLEKRLGRERCAVALRHLERGELKEMADLLLDYYDKAYAHASKRRSAPKFILRRDHESIR